MNTTLPNGVLLNFYLQHLQLENSNPFLCFLLRGRLNDYVREYGIRTKTVLDKKKEIEKKYFKHDEKENIMFEGEGDEKKPILNEGMTIEDFSKEMDEYLNATGRNIVTLHKV